MFLIALRDDTVYNDIPVAKQLIDNYSKYSSSIVGCQEVKEVDVSKYRIIKSSKSLDEKTVEMVDFIEKSSIEEAPSKLACLERYLLTSKIFEYVEKTELGKDREVIVAMMNDRVKILTYNFNGRKYDVGNKFGLLKANIEFGVDKRGTIRIS